MRPGTCSHQATLPNKFNLPVRIEAYIRSLTNDSIAASSAKLGCGAACLERQRAMEAINTHSRDHGSVMPDRARKA
jgi:hypothetical protein